MPVTEDSFQGIFEIYRMHKATWSCFSYLRGVVLGVPALPKEKDMLVACCQRGEDWIYPERTWEKEPNVPAMGDARSQMDLFRSRKH